MFNKRFTEELQILVGVVQTEKAIYESDDLRLPRSKKALALAYKLHGKVKNAIWVPEEHVRGSPENWINQSNPFSSQTNLAVDYYDYGRLKEAIDLWEKVVSHGKERMEQQSPDFLFSLTNLGVAYYYFGQIKTQIEFFSKLCKKEKSVSPSRRPSSSPLKSPARNGLHYMRAGDSKKAAKLVKNLPASK